MKRHVSMFIVISGIVFFGSTVLLAGVVMGPNLNVWWERDAANATWQEWHFDDGDNPADPEQYSNPFDTEAPTAVISVSGDAHGFEPGWYESWNGRNGVWQSDMTDILITIPNTSEIGGSKEIWLEIGFRGHLLPDEAYPDYPAEEYAPRVTPIAGEGQTEWTVEEIGRELDLFLDGWKRLTIGWKVYPNPAGEEIYLAFHNSGADIDYCIVDTLCMPEPATILVLGFGAMAMVMAKSVQDPKKKN